MQLQVFALVLRRRKTSLNQNFPNQDFSSIKASLNQASLDHGFSRRGQHSILLGAVLVMAGILSSLLALRFGAPLLLVFLLIGMLAGDSGPGQLQFDDVPHHYLVGSVALALILFDGGLKTRFQSIRTCWRRR